MKLWFCGMSGPNSLENLKELIEPIRAFFDGVVWVLHDSRESEEAQYLESIKGAGKIIHYYYSGRHGESRNQYLWCGPIQQDDWICVCDDLERLQPIFLERVKRDFISALEEKGVDIAYYYGKPILIRFHESMRYIGSPHESLRRMDGQENSIELNHIWPDENKVRLNVRPLKRTDPYGWVNHYCRYMLMPWGSNHSLLGLSDRGDPNVLFAPRERLRLEFLDEMRKRGFERTIDGVISMLSDPLDERLKTFLRSEKVWQDVYRYHVLKDLSVIDEHKWTSMVEIP